MRRPSPLLIGICTLVLAATGCRGGNGESNSSFSVEEVEEGFAEAGEDLVRQKTGPFRVGNESGGCQEVHAKDFRVSITVCSSHERGPLLMRFIPTQPPHEFHSTDDMLTFLKSNDSKGVTALLIVAPRNITVTYVGRDPGRVERIERALARLA